MCVLMAPRDDPLVLLFRLHHSSSATPSIISQARSLFFLFCGGEKNRVWCHSVSRVVLQSPDLGDLLICTEQLNKLVNMLLAAVLVAFISLLWLSLASASPASTLMKRTQGTLIAGNEDRKCGEYRKCNMYRCQKHVNKLVKLFFRPHIKEKVV